MYHKDFNENEHLSCPKCGFETVWALGKKERTFFRMVKLIMKL